MIDTNKVEVSSEVASSSEHVECPRRSVVAAADYILVDALRRMLTDEQISTLNITEILKREIQLVCKEAAVDIPLTFG
jgi:hypothetical protein